MSNLIKTMKKEIKRKKKTVSSKCTSVSFDLIYAEKEARWMNTQECLRGAFICLTFWEIGTENVTSVGLELTFYLWMVGRGEALKCGDINRAWRALLVYTSMYLPAKNTRGCGGGAPGAGFGGGGGATGAAKRS